jgi:hypothetical protein
MLWVRLHSSSFFDSLAVRGSASKKISWFRRSFHGFTGSVVCRLVWEEAMDRTSHGKLNVACAGDLLIAQTSTSTQAHLVFAVVGTCIANTHVCGVFSPVLVLWALLAM